MTATIEKKPLKTQTVYCRDERSDKFWQAIIPARTAAGFFVLTYYGPRGGHVSQKSYGPFDSFEAAEEIYDARLGEKLKGSKGSQYVPGPDYGEMAVDPEFARGAASVTEMPKRAFKPMLLNHITQAELLERIWSDDWWLQIKQDGVRCELHRKGDRVWGVSRKDLPLAIPAAVVRAAKETCPDDFIIDGELVGDVLYVFDIVDHNGVDLTGERYEDRKQIVDDHFLAAGSPIVAVKSYKKNQAKYDAFAEAKASGAEGVVLKLKSAPHQSGKPNSLGAALKFKFKNSASVIVMERVLGTTAASRKKMTARSVDIGYLVGRVLVRVGSVTIPPNHEVPKVGQVIEVEFLYRSAENGSLVQAVYRGVRIDVRKSECVASQFRVKNTPPDDDDAE